MPLKEAIVVNPKRKLSVPTYNKEQIKEIAREADHADSYEELVPLVNKGIENGDIAIPAGGTKLYIHRVVLANNVSLFIINTRQAKYTDAEDAVNGISDIATIKARVGPVSLALSAQQSSATTFTVRGVASSGSSESFTVTLPETTNDEVTEL